MSKSSGKKMKNSVKASSYVECSALKKYGVNECFVEAVSYQWPVAIIYLSKCEVMPIRTDDRGILALTVWIRFADYHCRLFRVYPFWQYCHIISLVYKVDFYLSIICIFFGW